MPPAFATAAAATSGDVPPELLQQAMDWLVELRERDASEELRQRWCTWRARTAQHEQAWQQAERLQAALAQRFGTVPAAIAGATLRQPAHRARSGAGLGLSAALLAGIAGWALSGYLPDPAQPAEVLRTAVGEQHTRTLADGTRLTLNTASELAVRYRRGQRLLTLTSGEVLVESGADEAYAHKRPLLLEVPQGSVTPIGTRFTARLLDETTASVAVLEGAVIIQPQSGEAERLDAGQTASLTRQDATAPTISAPGTGAWSQGTLIANDQPFCTFLAELDRYHRKNLHCDPALAARRISGAYALRDPARALALAADALKLHAEPLADGDIQLGPD